MTKVKCDNCQKNWMEPSSGVYIGYYHDDKDSKKLHVCYDCYRDKEQEYLQNYAWIYSYKKEHYEKRGTGYLKTDSSNCYADKKGSDGKVLKQKDCRHCSPWKFTGDNGNKEKCVNCEAVKNNFFEGEGKIFCSLECIDTYRKKNSPPQKPPIVPPKNNNNENRDIPPEKCSVCGKDTSTHQTSFRSKKSDGKSECYCSLECMREGTPSKNNPQQPNPLPKPQNNNKGMSAETKIILGVVIIFLIFIIGLIGAQVYKRSRPKTS